MSLPIEIKYQKLRCWNCGSKHTTTQESCTYCHGWVLPTRKKEDRTPIECDVFVIASWDSDSDKNKKLKNADAAIRNGRRTAILGTTSPLSPYSLLRTEKTAVFLHRPGEEALLSLTKLDRGNLSASPRIGVKIGLSERKAFEEVVGVPKVANFLPESFAKPGHLL